MRVVENALRAAVYVRAYVPLCLIGCSAVNVAVGRRESWRAGKDEGVVDLSVAWVVVYLWCCTVGGCSDGVTCHLLLVG